MRVQARLVFEDGTTFSGTVFAGSQDRQGEVVFNTAMCGYQEVLTDPSYANQMVVMTYPMIGNYGITEDDMESRAVFLSAFLVREYCHVPSNFRATQSLKDFLEQHGILGVEGLDTRAITRFVREKGAQRAYLCTDKTPIETLVEKVKKVPKMTGQNLAEQVSIDAPYNWSKPNVPKFKVAVLDYGVKYNILRSLSDEGCECRVFSWDVTADQLLNAGYDGVFLSNGPGDPDAVQVAIKTIKSLLGKLPIFGICLGHQLLGLAMGAKAFKLEFGHHGVNQPVKNLKTGAVEITSQNHGFALDPKSLNDRDAEVTHINLNDQTVEGLRHKRYPAFSVQYHPESAPGPHDSQYLFKEFISLMESSKIKVKDGTS